MPEAVTDSPTIGVIVPVYNRPRLIVEAVENVWAQARPPTTLVVVDDGSTDGTGDAVEAMLREQSSRCETRLLRKPNGGAPSAINRGAAELAHCELLCVHDSDDLWPADYLERMAAAMADRPDAVAASADRKTVDVATGEQEPRSSAAADGMVTQRFFLHGTPIPSITVARGGHWRAVGGFDERLRCSYDVDFHLRLSLRGPWLYVPGEPVIVRRGTAAKFGGSGHLTDDLRSLSLRIEKAELFDRFIHEHGGGAVLPGCVWRRPLARQWHRIGRDLRRAGRRAEAAWCYRRAAQLHPTRARAWFWSGMLGRGQRPAAGAAGGAVDSHAAWR